MNSKNYRFWPISFILGIFSLALAFGTVAYGAIAYGASKSSTQTAPPVHNSISTPYPILFVTQIPIPNDFTTVGAVIGNHLPTLQNAGRGGDLWIRYPDGALKNLTETAGYGRSGFQGADSIAVRDPHVHWDGQKALFSMAIGAPTEQYVWETYFWQIYEITGLGPNETPVIIKIANQPANYNNVAPIYASDDQIIFASDRPRNGAAHLYPQLDEYESVPTTTGLWKLNPATAVLTLLNHAPSGNFEPIVDSYGRLIFTQWDHLQRDQQADADNYDEANGQPCTYCAFNYTNESVNATPLLNRNEIFPEPRADQDLVGSNLWGHTINHFFPWMMNQDGTNLETLNHIGRHELHEYIPPSLTDDPNLVEYYGQYPRFNTNAIFNMLQIEELPQQPGQYIATDAPEFYTHASGQIFTLNGPPDTNGDQMAVTYLTHPDTADFTSTPSANHSGLYRDPLPLSDGAIIVAHTSTTDADENVGSREYPLSRYDYRLKNLMPATNGYQEAGELLTTGITKSVSWWDPDYLVHYDGLLWEWQPVEVRPRSRPTPSTTPLPTIEQNLFVQAGVSLAEMQAYLRQNNLALIISRNVTTRDDLDLQQPFNLRIAGTNTQTIGAEGHIYDISHLQLFQADQLRGYDWNGSGPPPDTGRRVIAQQMHDPAAMAANMFAPDAPASSVTLGNDGSMAAFVPAQRAVSWQLTDPAGQGVVRERYWLTFQPGEVRVCTSCHGLNEQDQAGQLDPMNPPQALLDLLTHWRNDGCQAPDSDCQYNYLPLVSSAP